MNRRPSTFAAKLLLSLLVLGIGAASRGSAGEDAALPLIERARPDSARQTRSAAWLRSLAAQKPLLLLAIVELERERDHWNSGVGGLRCRRAGRALERVDRDGLLRVADYRLVSATGAGLMALEGAVRACRERRYFALDYRLGVARRSLGAAQSLAEEQSSR